MTLQDWIALGSLALAAAGTIASVWRVLNGRIARLQHEITQERERFRREMAANKLEYYQTFAQRETIDAIDRKLDARFKDLKSDLGSEIHLLSTRLDRIIARFGSEPRSRNG